MEIEAITSLPFENPKLIPFTAPSFVKTDILKQLKHLFGFLPPSEQMILFNNFADATSSNLFLDNYVIDLKNEKHVLLQQKSLSEMLSANAKRFRSGLGCLKKVSNQFQKSSVEDFALLENISLNIQDMLHASNQLNHCEMNFLKVLFENTNKKKAILLKITTANYNNINKDGSKYFTYNNEGVISGVKYDIDDRNAILKEFKNYATCQQAFNNVVHRKGMETIISISQMQRCLNVDNPNKRAGRSSNEYKNPSNNYKDDEWIGNNNATGIRTDKRTQNNYLLNKGYRFGTINVQLDANDIPILPISPEWKIKLTAFRDEGNSNDLKSKINSILNMPSQGKPFSNLHNFLFQTLNNINPVEYQEFLISGCSQAFKFECNPVCSIMPEGTIVPGPFTNQPFTELKYEDYYGPSFSNINSDKYNFNFVVSNPYLAVICNTGKMQIYSEGIHPILGKVFEYYEDGKSVGSDMSNINQACFGVFTSGGKNDKDACRDTMNKECGSELDYRCKESGLYDFITQNPPAKTTLPSFCMSTRIEEECFDWITKTFISGSISLKPSGFLSFSINAQITSNLGKEADNKYHQKPVELTEATELGQYKNEVLKLQALISNNEFYVEKNKPGVFSDIGSFQIEMERTLMIQISTSYFLTSLNAFLLLILYI